LGTAKCLAYLHNLPTPLIHRDIKSANILLDEDNNAKVTLHYYITVKESKLKIILDI